MIDWNKGKAVEFLLESLGLGNSDAVLPIYVGDDRTDEDAFKVIVHKCFNRGSKMGATNLLFCLDVCLLEIVL